MSSDLILTYKGDDVAGIGKSHRYFKDVLLNKDNNESMYNKLDKKAEQFKSKFLIDLIDSCYTLEELVDTFQKGCIKVGRTQAIIECIDEYGELEIVESI